MGVSNHSKLSDYCKSFGLNVNKVIETSGESRRTLNNWFNDNFRRVELLLKGIASEAKKIIVKDDYFQCEFGSKELTQLLIKNKQLLPVEIINQLEKGQEYRYSVIIRRKEDI